MDGKERRIRHANRELLADAPVDAAIDQSAIDQRVGRAYAEVEATRRDIAAEAAVKNAVWLGAWLALSWLVDDAEHPLPLRDRLRNAENAR